MKVRALSVSVASTGAEGGTTGMRPELENKIVGVDMRPRRYVLRRPADRLRVFDDRLSGVDRANCHLVPRIDGNEHRGAAGQRLASLDAAVGDSDIVGVGQDNAS